MGRKTRAAARAQEMPDDAPQTEEACSIPLPPTPSKHDRGPLRNITPNNVESVDVEPPADEADDMAQSKGKKGKKAGGKKKGKKAKAETSEEGEQADDAVAESPEAEEEAPATSGAPSLDETPDEVEKTGTLNIASAALSIR